MKRRGPGIEQHQAPIAGQFVNIDVTNHRGKRAVRTVLPTGIWFGTSKWHEGQGWFLEAWDEGKGAWRTFRMDDIHAWAHAEAADEGE